MSEHAANKLPPPLRFELGNIAEYQHANAALLISVDEGGFPRVAIISASEITSPDESTLRVKLHASSHTSKNLSARGRAVLWSVLDAAAYSVRAAVTTPEVATLEAPTPEATTQAPGWRSFELHVLEVLRDFQPDAPLLSGPTYKRV